jgi:hypothetical protein
MGCLLKPQIWTRVTTQPPCKEIKIISLGRIGRFWLEAQNLTSLRPSRPRKLVALSWRRCKIAPNSQFITIRLFVCRMSTRAPSKTKGKVLHSCTSGISNHNWARLKSNNETEIISRRRMESRRTQQQWCSAGCQQRKTSQWPRTTQF